MKREPKYLPGCTAARTDAKTDGKSITAERYGYQSDLGDVQAQWLLFRMPVCSDMDDNDGNVVFTAVFQCRL